MKHLYLLTIILSVAIIMGGSLFAQNRPSIAYPITDGKLINLSKQQLDIQSLPSRFPRELFAVGTSCTDGGNRLVSTQNTDGGWGWPLTGTSAPNTIGPIAMGLAQAYQQTAVTGFRTALAKTGTYLLTKVYNFSPSDGYLAAQLDKIFGGTTYRTHVKTYFYDQLAAGTYNRNGSGTLYSTTTYVNLIRTSRSGSIANLAAWDIGMGLVGAAMCEESTAEWIAGVKAEIDELDGDEYYDVIGLAGAVYGLAFVDEDYDPTAGEHAAASDIDDLAAILASYQIDGGGFAWNSNYVIPDDGNETIQETGYAILALNEVNRNTYLSAIQGAADYMMSVQLDTGGWENYTGSGENNEVTGEALWGICIAYLRVHNVTKDIYYETIQDAINASDPGDIINVAAGTYNEALNINKSLTLNGAKVGLDARTRSTSSGESIIDGTGFTTAQYSLIMIANGVSDVVIDGFEFRNILLTSTGGGVGNAISSYCNSSSTAGANNITIQNNYMHDLGYNGILVVSENTTGTSMIVQTGWVIQYNKITTYRYAGVELTNVTDSQVKDNDIAAPVTLVDDPGDAGVGIEIAARSRAKPVTAGTNVEVSGNTITGTFPTGSRAVINLLSRTYTLTSNATLSTVTVSENNISGATNVRAAVLAVAESRNNGPATISTLAITDNILDGNLDGIEIQDYVKSGSGTATHSAITATGNEITNGTACGLHLLTATSAAGITVSSNKILTNALFGINNEGTGTLNASGNWWGSNVPATVATKVSANVDYTPWLNNGTDIGDPGFQGDFSILWVDDDSPQTGSVGRIEEGVDMVTASTVNVAAGTYTEGYPQVVIDKDVTISGADKTTTIINPGANTSGSGDGRGWFLVNTDKEFNLNNVTLDGSGKNIFMAVLSHGTGTIDNNIIKNFKYSKYLGMGLMMYGGNFVISNNTLSNIERIGMYCNGTGVTDGQFIDNTYTGKGDGDWIDYGIEIEKGAVATVTGNTITNCTGVAASDGSTSAGMYLTTYFALGTTGTYTNNILMNNYVGLQVGYLPDDASVAVAHDNIFVGNTGYGIHSTNPMVDAEYNYWGSVHGPLDVIGTVEMPGNPATPVADMKNMIPADKMGDAVSENVDYYKWQGKNNQNAGGGGVWAGGYVNPTSNDIFAGFDPAALDGVDSRDTVAPPPPPTDYLYLYFLLAPGEPLENYYCDVKKEEASLATAAKHWDLKALTDHTSELIMIEFPTAGLPSGFKPTLYDLATGDYQNLSDNPFYEYTSPATEVPSSFLILIGDSTKPTVSVTTPNGGEFLVVGQPYTVTWSSSDGTGVLRHYIYWSSTGAAPYTLIDSVNGGVYSYNWTPTLASNSASIKVTARDSVMNEETDISNYTFWVLATNSASYSAIAGWNLISVPIQQTDMTPAGVFGDDYAVPYYTFQYNSTTGYSIPSTLNMGQGYWLGSNSAQVVDAVGTPLSTVDFALTNGFNIIGNPYVVSILKADLRFTDGIDTWTMVEAATAGWLSNVLYGYNGGYIVEGTSLGVWNGYWIPMLTSGITIQYRTGLGVPTPGTVPAFATDAADGWGVELGADLQMIDGTVSDHISSFGVNAEATAGFDPLFDAPRPPRSPFVRYVEVSFVVDPAEYPTGIGSSIARDYRNSGEAGWEFIVNASHEGTVTLTWDNSCISRLPSDINVELYDPAAGRMIDMKRTSSYSYDQNGTTRRFLVNRDDKEVPVSFELIQNYPNPFNPITKVQYGLPTDANVKVVIYDYLGRQVAVLTDGFVKAGYHEATFDASRLASGVYIYRLTAIGTNGTPFFDSKKMILAR